MPPPLIQELANAPTSSTPGFAYVPDTGFDPSKEAIVPTGARRAARATAASYGGESLTKQEQQKVTRRIAELERDNRADVHIVLPGKPSNVAQRGQGIRDKMTTNVKKIMQSQKTIANHLADEEAAIANAGSGNVMPTTSLQRGQSSRQSMSDRRASANVKNATSDEMDIDVEGDGSQIYKAPAYPSDAELEGLINAPALSYAASRVAPSTSTLPPRRFCLMCGYWGRVRCKTCGDRVCGLECLASHQETCQRY